MLKLIKRCPEYVMGYRDYCREMHACKVVYFRPTDPNNIDEGWFERTKPMYDQKEKGLPGGHIPSIHFWAIDGDNFIGEFQLRTAFSQKVMTDIGSIGYAVRPSEWGKGYGTQILTLGLKVAKEYGMQKVLLTINENNTASVCVCEKLGGKWADTIEAYNADEGYHLIRRYWIEL